MAGSNGRGPRGTDPTDYHGQIRWLQVSNAGAAVPGWGLVLVTGEDADGRFTVTAPTADGQENLLVAGPAGIPAGGVGLATWFDWVPVYYLAADGTPAAGETWGSASGQHYARKNNDGYKVVGTPSGGAVEMVRDVPTEADCLACVDDILSRLCVVKDGDGFVTDVKYEKEEGTYETVPECGAESWLSGYDWWCAAYDGGTAGIFPFPEGVTPESPWSTTSGPHETLEIAEAACPSNAARFDSFCDVEAEEIPVRVRFVSPLDGVDESWLLPYVGLSGGNYVWRLDFTPMTIGTDTFDFVEFRVAEACNSGEVDIGEDGVADHVALAAYGTDDVTSTSPLYLVMRAGNGGESVSTNTAPLGGGLGSSDPDVPFVEVTL